MKKKLIAVFLLIVLLPLAVISWLGMRSIGNEQEREHRRYADVLENRLKDMDKRIADLIELKEIELLQLDTITSSDVADIRSYIRKSRYVRQIFILDSNGVMVFPPEEVLRSTKEDEFFLRIGSIDLTKDVLAKPSDRNPDASASSGWYTWFWGEGINFIYWFLDAQGRTIGIEVERTALFSDLISILPETEIRERRESDGRIILSNASEKIIYQWGNYQPGDSEEPAAFVSVSNPLSSWKLKYFIAQDEGFDSFFSGRYFTLIISAIVLVIAVVGLAIYFYRENSREIREAMQRMSFVNQVSHELKTPLTNIRMYAELLESSVVSENEKDRKHLEVVVSESRRLSRLIGNILTFARNQKNGLRLSAKPGVVDETIFATLASNKPALEAAGIVVGFAPGAGDIVYFDADILDQILHNLISNVEKYASSGKSLKIESIRDGSNTIIKVSDRGPGIPARQRENIFKPFVRLSNKLTDGVSGTGIGLTIARDLAILHEGRLELENSPGGATFVLTIRAPADREN